MTHAPADPARGAVLALDIGGTKLAAGVVRADGEVLSFVTCPTESAAGPEASLARLFDLGKHALDQAGVDPGDAPAHLLGCGIGCGGPLDPGRGVLLCPPHLPGWVDVPITRLVEDTYGLRAVLDNDGTAGAAGEWRFGAGRGTRHLVYLTVSTGIGGGFVVDGRTYRGAAGNGGEPGHITVRSDGRPCRACGRSGCLEAYASGTSISELAREAVALGEATSLPPDATAVDVSRQARAGDPLARRLWDQTTSLLGQGVTSIVNLYEPDVVVLGGGVTRAGEQLLSPVRQAVARLAMGPAARAVRVVPAGNGDRAGVLGAAAVAFERLTGTAAASQVPDTAALT